MTEPTNRGMMKAGHSVTPTAYRFRRETAHLIRMITLVIPSLFEGIVHSMKVTLLNRFCSMYQNFTLELPPTSTEGGGGSPFS
jgi:hypothetical protein